jgi:hypothetical protein
MDFQNEYDSVTDNINSIVSTQLSSALQWSNIPGSLVKASSSAAGYAWGYNASNVVYVCQLPCNGNWQPVTLDTYNIASIQDLTTDTSNVYILMTDKSGNNNLLIGPATNQGSWNVIPVPFAATSIFSTNTYIWAQDGSNNKQKCPKPCTSPNWMANPDKTVKITSASTSSLYGTDGSGNAMRSDENLQSGWSSISGLSGLKLKTLIGQADQTALYGIDMSSSAYVCQGDCTTPQEVDPLDTGGFMPLNLTTDGQKLWMTTTTAGEKGNIFNRVNTPDYSSIMNEVTPLDQNREKIVDNIDNAYNQQTQLMVANKQISTVVDFFSKMFKFDSDSAKQTKNQESRLHDQVQDIQNKLGQVTTLQPLIQKLLIVVAVVAGIYMFGSFLGWIIHIVAFVVLAIGVGYSIYSQSNQ